jgi:hypothetical protein
MCRDMYPLIDRTKIMVVNIMFVFSFGIQASVLVDEEGAVEQELGGSSTDSGSQLLNGKNVWK